jgi:hypothetical protein
MSTGSREPLSCCCQVRGPGGPRLRRKEVDIGEDEGQGVWKVGWERGE